MRTSLASRIVLGAITAFTLAFLYVPLFVVARLSFTKANSIAWPADGWTTKWWHEAWNTDGPREALLNSIKVASAATLIALVLGTLAAFALQRFEFFGRNAFSFLMVLPIALPGIVTGIALQNTFSREIDLGPIEFKIGFGFHSLVIAHATFCVVVAYNNVIARLRRSSPNLLEASADLGAHGTQTFRYVTFPLVRSALVAGGILAFALSFDEIVVTTFTAGAGFQTLPQWIYANFARPTSPAVVNVVATFVMIVSIPLAWLAQRLGDSDPGAMSEPISDSALLDAALDAARVLDDFIGHVVGVNDGRIGGWDDAQKGWRRAFAGNRVFGQKHVVQGMGAAFSGEQLRKASVEAGELVTAIAALRAARSEVAVQAAIDAVELGVDEFPVTLADDSLSSRSPQVTDLYQRLTRVIGVLTEARTKTLLAEMRARTADPADPPD